MSLHTDRVPEHPLALQTPKSELTQVTPAPLAPTHPTTLPKPSVRSAAATVHRRLAPVVRIILGFCTFAGFLLSVLGLLLAFGHTQLVASLIVGAVLCVVFGTPLLCVIGIIVFYLWAMTRVHRRPRPSTQQTTASPRAASVVTEVILDE